MVKNIEPIAFNAFRCWTASAREQMPGLIINEEDDQKIIADFKAVLIDALEFVDKQVQGLYLLLTSRGEVFKIVEE